MSAVRGECDRCGGFHNVSCDEDSCEAICELCRRGIVSFEPGRIIYKSEEAAAADEDLRGNEPYRVKGRPTCEIITTPRLQLVYEPGCRCPQCAGLGWHVGRISAECMTCGYPMPLADSSTRGASFAVGGRIAPGWKGVNHAR